MTLHVHTQMREDALTLYGFASLEDRSALCTLLGVNGVGPKLALGIMSSLNCERAPPTPSTAATRRASRG